MNLEFNEDMANVAAELNEIRKFEKTSEVEEFVSITALCSALLSLVCC